VLTTEEIQLILERLRETTVIEPGAVFPYRISARGSFGYSNDPTIGALQAKLSIMLEVAHKRSNDAHALLDSVYQPTRELAELRARRWSWRWKPGLMACREPSNCARW
jgi:hypothetical protein